MVKTRVIKLRVTEGLNTRDQIALDAFNSFASFSNDDSDGNGSENVKATIGLLSKTTSLHLHHAFSYISLLLLLEYYVKMPRYMEDVNNRRRNVLSLSKLECCPQEINCREICLH